MKVQFLHLSRVRISALFLFIAFFLYQNSIFAYANRLENTLLTQEITLIEAIHHISEQYQVLFNYDRNIVSDIKVQYEPKEFENVDAAIASILKETNLKYQIFSQRYVVIYKNDEEGIESLKKMIEHFQAIVDDREGIVLERQRQKPSPKLIRSLPQDVLGDKTIAFSIEGSVRDQEGEPLIGVNIQVKGTNIGTSTDFDGKFAIDDIDENAVLVVSYIGYQTQEVPVAGKSNLSIVLLSDSQLLDEVVVVGYGTQKKTSLTSAVSSIGGEEISSIPITNISNSIAGRLSGVITKQGSGEPGVDGSNIYIRGISTIGSTQPLLIVDGVPRNFQNLDPNSIETITVLKDAAAVAPYGVAGANGVILVTTKQGRRGKPIVSYNGYVGFQNPTMVPNIANSYEFAILRNLANENNGSPLPFSDEEIQKFKDGSDPDRFPPHFDVYDEIITKNAPINNHSISVSGGRDNFDYYFNFGFQDQAGMWSTSNANRFNITANFSGDLTETTNFAIKINGINKISNHPATTHDGSIGSSTQRVFELAKYAVPTTGGPLFFSNGLIGHHVSAAIWGSGYRKLDDTDIYAQIELNQSIPFIKGLSIGGKIAVDPSWGERKLWSIPNHLASVDHSKEPYEIVDGIYGKTKASLSQNFEKRVNKLYQGNIEYANQFSLHSIKFIGIFEAISRNIHSLDASRINYVLGIDEINMGSSSNNDFTTGGSSSEFRQVGLVYRLSYAYDTRFLTEFSGRYDGHYYFAPGNRFGFFPAFSLGWRLSEEKFLKNITSKWLYNLKLRASYGEIGALAGGPFQYLSTYAVSGPGYTIGQSGVQVINEKAEPNVNITWERARKTDIGIEISLWKGLINLEADYFYEKRSNMLINPNVITPAEYGIGLSQVNEAVMENKGIELLLNSNYQFNSDFYVGLNATVTYARNKVLEIFETDATYNNPNRRRTGRSLGTQFGYKALGYFQNDDFDNEGNLLPGIPAQPWGKVRPGDIRYWDTNGDGQFNSSDEVPIGDPNTPGMIYGIAPVIRYKDLSLEVLFQGVNNSDFYLSGSGIWSFETGRAAFVKNFDHWTVDNTDAFYPRLEPVVSTNNRQRSSKWMMDVSYLRLKNINLSYSLPNSLLEKTFLQNCLIYISGQNLYTWAGDILEFADPENLNSGGYFYPQQKVISVGLTLSF